MDIEHVTVRVIYIAAGRFNGVGAPRLQLVLEVFTGCKVLSTELWKGGLRVARPIELSDGYDVCHKPLHQELLSSQSLQ